MASINSQQTNKTLTSEEHEIKERFNALRINTEKVGSVKAKQEYSNYGSDLKEIAKVMDRNILPCSVSFRLDRDGFELQENPNYRFTDVNLYPCDVDHEFDKSDLLGFPNLEETESNFDILMFHLSSVIHKAEEHEVESSGMIIDIFAPLWFLIQIRAYHWSVFYSHSHFSKAFALVSYQPYAKTSLNKVLVNSSPRLIDAHLKVIASHRKIEGLQIQIINLQRSLSKANHSQHNNFKTKELLLRNAEAYLKAESVRLKASVSQLNSIEQEEGIKDEIFEPAMDMENQQADKNFETVAQNTALGATGVETETIVIQKPANTEFVDEILTDKCHKYPDLVERWIEIDKVDITPKLTPGQVVRIWHLPAQAIVSKWDTPNSNPFKIHEFFKGSISVKMNWNISKHNQYAAQFGVIYHWLQRDRPSELVNVWSVSQQPGFRLIGHMKNSDEIRIPFESYLPAIPIRSNNFSQNLYFVSLVMVSMTSFEVADGGSDRSTLKVYMKFEDDLRFYGLRPSINEVPEFVPFKKIERKQELILGSKEKAGTFIKPSKRVEIFGKPQEEKKPKSNVADKNKITKKGRSVREANGEQIEESNQEDMEPAMDRIVSGIVDSANSLVRGSLKIANDAILSKVSGTLSGVLGSKPMDTQNKALHIRATTSIATGSGEYACDVLRLNHSAVTPAGEFLLGEEKYDNIKNLMHVMGFVNSFKTKVTDGVGTVLFRTNIQLGTANQVQAGDLNFSNKDFLNWTPCDHLASWYCNQQVKIHYRFQCVADGFKTFRLRAVYAPNVTEISYEQSDSYYFETFDVGPSLNTQQTFDFIVPYINNQLNFHTRRSDAQANIAGCVMVFLETEIDVNSQMYDSFDTLVYKRVCPGEGVFSVLKDSTSMLVYDPKDVPSPEIPDNPPPPPPGPVWRDDTLRFQVYQFSVSPSGWSGTLRMQVVGSQVFVDRVVGSAITAFAFLTADRMRSANNHENQAWGTGAVEFIGTWNPSTVRIQLFGNHIITIPIDGIVDGLIYSYDIQFMGQAVVPSLANGNLKDALKAATEEEELIAAMDTGEDHREPNIEKDKLTNEIKCLDEAIHGESHMELYSVLRRFEDLMSRVIDVPNSEELTRVLRLPINFGGPLFRDEMNKKQRTSKIVHIHDAMRFVRGSLRYFFTVEGSSEGTLTFRHVPQTNEYPLTDGEQTIQNSDAVTGYGETIMSLRLNNNHHFECPMYLPTNCVLNASYLSDEALTQVSQGLGVLEVFWTGPAKRLVLNIKRALGNDTKFYMFNGFPLRVPIELKTGNHYYAEKMYPAMMTIGDTLEQANIAFHNWNENIQEKLNNTLDSVGDAAETIKDFRKYLGGSAGVGSHTSTVLLQIAQCLNNPTAITFALSGAQVLVSFNLFNMDTVHSIQGMFTNVWEAITSDKGVNLEWEDEVIPSMSTKTTLVDLASMLTTALCSYFKVSSKTGDFSTKLELGFTYGATIHAKILGFFSKIFEFIRSSIVYIMENYFPNSRFYKWLTSDHLVTWNEHANIVINPACWPRIKQNPEAATFVFLLTKVGEKFLIDSARDSRGNTALCRQTQITMSRLYKLRDYLSKFVGQPLVKYDPFCFYIAGGESQIGKSKMMTSLCLEIANQTFGVKPGTKPVYVVPESETYWEQYDGQEIIIFDDFNRAKRQDVCETDSARLSSLKGSADSTAPKAFEDKGRLCTPKLIGCASNYAYPRVNGILDSVVWKRRNVLFEVIADFSVYKHCASCSKFRFGCGLCFSMNPAEDYNKRAHLKFKESDPENPNSVSLKENLTYDEMREVLMTKAMQYYEVTDAQHKLALEEVRQFCSFAKSDYVISEDVLDEYSKFISTPKFSNIIENIQGLREMENMNPAMFSMIGRGVNYLIDKMFGDMIEDALHEVGYEFSQPGRDRMYELHTELLLEDQPKPRYSECLHLNVDGLLLTFTDTGYRFSNGVTNVSCGANCTWRFREAAFITDYLKDYQKVHGHLPEKTPGYFDPENRAFLMNLIREQMDEENRAVGMRTALKMLAVIAPIIAGLVGYNLMCVWEFGKTVARKEKIIDELENDLEKMEKEHFELASKHQPQSVKSDYICFEPEEYEMSKCHPALQTSGDIKTKFSARFQTRTKIVPNKNFVRATPASDNEKNIMLKCYENSMIEIRAQAEPNSVARCISVGKKLYLTQAHSMFTILAMTRESNGSFSGKIILKRTTANGNMEEKTITSDQLLQMNGGSFQVETGGSDMIVFRIDIEGFRTENISRYLLKSEGSQYLSPENFKVYDPMRIGVDTKCKEFKAVNVTNISQSVVYKKDSISQWTEANEVKFILDGYRCLQIDFERFRNACGSIIFDDYTLTILGFLSAASKQANYFNAFSYDNLVSVMQYYKNLDLKTINVSGSNITLYPQRKDFIQVDGVEVFEINPAMSLYHSTKTTLKKSACHGEFGRTIRSPCNISQDGDKGQKALENGLRNYVPHKEFPEQDMEEALFDVKMMFRRLCRPVIPIQSKRSLSEAVCGIPGHVSRISMSTSPGFPWCCCTNTKRKSDLLRFNEEHALTEIHEDLFELVERNEKMMKKGEVPVTIYQISHKDERLVHEKLDNVRLIQGSPLDATISARKFLMDFNLAFQEHRNNLEHQVGINITSIEWDNMTRKLIDFSPYICVGDFSKFGPRLLTKFVRNAYEVMVDWYEHNGAGEDSTTRRILGERAVDSYNMAYNRVFKLKCGSPSGAINTVIVNSLCNMFYIRCAWIGIMKEKNITISSLSSFRKYVKFICYGDDVIFAVHPAVIEDFNNSVISEYFAGFGVKYTDVTKGETMRKYCSIEDATFLKCGFKFFTETAFTPGVWVCLPNIEDIKDTTNWVRIPKGTRKSVDQEWIIKVGTVANCNDAIRKIWFHGRDTFEEFQKKVHHFFKDEKPELQPEYFDFFGLQREYGYPLKGDSFLANAQGYSDAQCGKVILIPNQGILENKINPECSDGSEHDSESVWDDTS